MLDASVVDAEPIVCEGPREVCPLACSVSGMICAPAHPVVSARALLGFWAVRMSPEADLQAASCWPQGNHRRGAEEEESSHLTLSH